jgi:hypothetical protein
MAMRLRLLTTALSALGMALVILMVGALPVGWGLDRQARSS